MAADVTRGVVVRFYCDGCAECEQGQESWGGSSSSFGFMAILTGNGYC